MQQNEGTSNSWIKNFIESEKSCVSLGCIPADIVAFLSEKCPDLISGLSSETEILFWKDRIAHTERHKDDFISDIAFYNCLEDIPNIIRNPDYLSVHPRDRSISFIKDYSSHIAVAVRVYADGKLSYRTMYPLTDAQLTNYIQKGRAWRLKSP
ncbi:MAG: hypothetical protein LUG61_07755 [Lachnospiraceae bacterium]|nr:hypothetical protein [Lachnospiraceae bacterium]